MKRSLGISNFLQEISSLSHSVVFLYFFALISEEGFLISPVYSLKFCIKWEYLSFSPLFLAFPKVATIKYLVFPNTYKVLLSICRPWWLRWKRVCLQCRRPEFDSWVGKIPWRREWQPTPVLLPGESHGQRNPVDNSPWAFTDSDMTEQPTLLLCIHIGLPRWLSSNEPTY